MAFFKGLFGRNIQIGAPMKGRVIPLSDVPDPAFSEGLLGPGVAIIPENGRVFAPCDGTVDSVFPTGHGITLSGSFGAEILIHIGLQTVTLKGKPFSVHVTAGQSVRKGRLLIEVDLDAIRASNLNPVTPVVICNSQDFSFCKPVSVEHVAPGDGILELKK